MKDNSIYDNVFGIDMKPLDDKNSLFERYKSVSTFDELFLNKKKKIHKEIEFVNDVKPKSLDSTGIMPILYVPIPGEETKKDMEDFIELKEYIKSSSKNSIRGKVYEWIKGVFVIDIDGELYKKSMDNADVDFSSITKEVISRIDDFKIKSDNLFEIGTIGADNGLIIFQSKKEDAIIYLPLEITKKQFESLQGEIIPRGGYNYSITHNNTVYENMFANDVLNYANNLAIVKNKRRYIRY